MLAIVRLSTVPANCMIVGNEVVNTKEERWACMSQRWEFQTSSEKENAMHTDQKHRSEAILWAIQKLNEGDFVILDTETTGTGESDQVVQIGILSSTGEIIYSGLAKPIGTRSFDKEVVAIHGITYEMVKNAPTMD